MRSGVGWLFLRPRGRGRARTGCHSIANRVAWCASVGPASGRPHLLMLQVGATAPSFLGRTADGNWVSLGDDVGQPMVIYFYRRAFTPNCTVETKGFRDNHEELRGKGYEVIGISADPLDRQCRFARSLDVRFPIVADEDRSICRAYEVLFPIIPVIRRVTYVLDEHHSVAATFHHEFQANKHLDDVLRFVERHTQRRPSAASATTPVGPISGVVRSRPPRSGAAPPPLRTPLATRAATAPPAMAKAAGAERRR